MREVLQGYVTNSIHDEEVLMGQRWVCDLWQLDTDCSLCIDCVDGLRGATIGGVPEGFVIEWYIKTL